MVPKYLGQFTKKRRKQEENYILDSYIKDTHREKALSNKAQALTKSANTGSYVVSISNQLFIKSSETKTKS